MKRCAVLALVFALVGCGESVLLDGASSFSGTTSIPSSSRPESTSSPPENSEFPPFTDSSSSPSSGSSGEGGSNMTQGVGGVGGIGEENSTGGGGAGGSEEVTCDLPLLLRPVADPTIDTRFIAVSGSFGVYEYENPCGIPREPSSVQIQIGEGGVYDFWLIATYSTEDAFAPAYDGGELDADGSVVLLFDPGSFVIPPYEKRTFEVVGFVADPVPFTTPGEGLPRSGDWISLEVTSSSEENGSPVVLEGDLTSVSHVLVNSYPEITPTSLPEEGLANGMQHVYAWTVTAHGGDLDQRQYALRTKIPVGASLCDPVLLMDGMVKSATVAEHSNGGWYPIVSHPYFVHCLEEGTREFTVRFSPQIPEILGENEARTFVIGFVASGIQSGSEIHTEFMRASSFVQHDLPCPMNPYADTISADELTGLIWSDLSVEPYALYACGNQTGTQWFGDYLLTDFSLAQVRKAL